MLCSAGNYIFSTSASQQCGRITFGWQLGCNAPEQVAPGASPVKPAPQTASTPAPAPTPKETTVRAAAAEPAPKSTRRHGLPLFLVQLVVNVALVAILVGFVTRWIFCLLCCNPHVVSAWPAHFCSECASDARMALKECSPFCRNFMQVMSVSHIALVDCQTL